LNGFGGIIMNIAELKGEKTVKTLAKRLLAESSKKTTNAEMEAALLRLNPHLAQIGDLEKGTPILVPDGFALASDESVPPSRGLADELVRQSEEALTRLRAELRERTAQSAEQSERVQTWVKSEQAREFLRQSPKLKELFSAAAAAAKALPKEQNAALAAQTKALEKVQSQLASFRRASRK
jgi:hypothetical protein